MINIFQASHFKKDLKKLKKRGKQLAKLKEVIKIITSEIKLYQLP